VFVRTHEFSTIGAIDRSKKVDDSGSFVEHAYAANAASASATQGGKLAPRMSPS
jgi:hypothetical protein